MKDLSKTIKGAILVVVSGKRFYEKNSWQCNFHPLIVHFTSQDLLLKQMKNCLRCLNTTLPLTEWTICKVLLLVNSSQLPHIHFFPTLLVLTVDLWNTNCGWINKQCSQLLANPVRLWCVSCHIPAYLPYCHWVCFIVLRNIYICNF